MDIQLRELDRIESLYKNNDYTGILNSPCKVISYGDVPILISAPHSLKQKRDGSIKAQEYYTGAIAEYLAKNIGCFVITKKSVSLEKYNDDANFEDSNCEYKKAIKEFIEENKIKLFVDIHGLSGNKLSIIDICVNNEKNIEDTVFHNMLYSRINESFSENMASIDKYFRADKPNVLSYWINQKYAIPAIELEINGKYRWFSDDCLEQSLKLLKNLYLWLIDCKDILEKE